MSRCVRQRIRFAPPRRGSPKADLVLTFLLAIVTASAAAIGPPAHTPATASAPAGEMTIEELQSRLTQLELIKGLSKVAQETIRRNYGDAIDRLKAVRAWTYWAAEYERHRAEAPWLLESLKSELDRPMTEASIDAPRGATPAQLQQALVAAQQEFEAAKKFAADLDSEPKRRADRYLSMPKDQARIREQIAAIDKDVETIAGRGEPGEVGRSMRVKLEATRRAFERQLEAGDKELAWYDATVEVLGLQRDQATRRVAAAEKNVRRRQKDVDDARRREQQQADEEALAARRAAAQAHPVAREIADRIVVIADERKALLARGAAAAKEVGALESDLNRVARGFEKVRKRFEAAGAEVGLFLRRQRDELPDARIHRRRIGARQPEIAKVQLRQLKLADERAELDDIDARTAAIMSRVDGSIGSDKREVIRKAVAEMLRDERTRLDELDRNYDEFLQRLLDLSVKESGLVDAVVRCAAYIDQRILWVPSRDPIDHDDFANVRPAFNWLTEPRSWTGVAQALYHDSLIHWYISMPAVLILGLLIGLRGRMVARLARIADLVGPIYSDRFGLTVQAVFLSAFIAVPGPGLAMYAAWRLVEFPDASDFGRAVAAGLFAASIACLPLELLRQICRKRGLAEAHFRWRAMKLKAVRRNLAWLILVLALLVFTAVTLVTADIDAWVSSLARFAAMAHCVAISVFTWRLLSRSGPAANAAAPQRKRFVDRSRIIWCPLLSILPLTLALLAGLGYGYTAFHIEKQLFQTACLVVGVKLLHAVLIRWVFVAHRRLSVDEARKRREAADAAPLAARTATGQAAPPVPVEPAIDLSAVNEQTHKILRAIATYAIVVGLWVIWQDVLPTIGLLQAPLWTHVGDVTVKAPSATGGEDVTQVEQRPIPVTVSDALLALVALVVTYIAARNIPGLLEISLLRRLPLERGGRYAITTLCRYVLTVIGIVLAFDQVGVSWSSVQWLIAAVTFGLGFGLQEIFANFVSGIIILFERPVRVGDTVTVGHVTGTVSRIRIRATTIRDADRKELIVPNKQFITDQIVNWTLSDRVLRLVVPVSVAYGSDPQQVRAILLDAAMRQARLLPAPEPEALFCGFADHALNFELTVYLASPDGAGRIKHELYIVILDALSTAGIALSSPPSRELRVSTPDGALPVVIRTERRA